jgi:hypothetical protein
MGFSDRSTCRKCRHEKEASYNTFCQCAVLAMHGPEVCGSAWLEVPRSRWLCLSIMVRACGMSIFIEKSAKTDIHCC